MAGALLLIRRIPPNGFDHLTRGRAHRGKAGTARPDRSAVGKRHLFSCSRCAVILRRCGRPVMYRWCAHVVSPSSLPQERPELSSALPATQTTATYVALQRPHDATQPAAPSSAELADTRECRANLPTRSKRSSSSRPAKIRSFATLVGSPSSLRRQAQMVRDRADAAEQLRMVQER